MTTYTLFEVLDAGTVVEVDFTMSVVVVWNKSATFNVFSQVSELGEIPAFELLDTFTNYNATSGTAQGIARRWLAGS